MIAVSKRGRRCVYLGPSTKRWSSSEIEREASFCVERDIEKIDKTAITKSDTGYERYLASVQFTANKSDGSGIYKLLYTSCGRAPLNVQFKCELQPNVYVITFTGQDCSLRVEEPQSVITRATCEVYD